MAAVDGLSARKRALAERLSRLAADEQWWPTVARLRCFRGIDTLTALALHLELGWRLAALPRAPALGSWLGLTPSLQQSGESARSGSITKTGSTLARRLLVEAAWHYSRAPGSAPPWPTASTVSPITSCRSQTAPSSACIASTSGCAPRQAGQRHRRGLRP